MKKFGRKFHDYMVQKEMTDYGVCHKQAKNVVKMMKRNDVVWNQMKNEWFDEIHPY